MKPAAIHSVTSFLLISFLLFGQLGVNFFHNNHDAHDADITLSDTETLVPHGEHCKVCSIDVFNQQLEVHRNSYSIPQSPDFYNSLEEKSFFSQDALCSNGRAPPFDLG